MSRRTIISLGVSVIVAAASITMVSTDAFAHKKAVHHRAAAVPPAAVPVIVTTSGPVADGIPRCIDSVLFYPYPPCY
ncbi:hypothetical protein [Bradyrhizobium sp.]|uniref:hypothetical protein n=1 Tax=Bradyrhizobium sp. TaxID=376 RepID=UPI003BB08127